MTNLNRVTIKYIGKGRGAIPGVPARDMSNDEARQYDITALLKSRLYKIAQSKKPKILVDDEIKKVKPQKTRQEEINEAIKEREKDKTPPKVEETAEEGE